MKLADQLAFRCRAVPPLLGFVSLFALLPAAVAADQAETFAAVKSAVDAKNFKSTKTIGGFGQTPFSDTPKKGCILIGFELGLGKFFNVDIVYAVRPIYLSADGECTGGAHGLFDSEIRSKVTRVVTVKAKPGYAVGRITGRAGLLLNGMSVTFMGINGARLDVNDKSQSEWIGDRTGGSEFTIDSQGALVVGIHGKANEVECGSLGLTYLGALKPVDNAVVPPSPTPVEKTRQAELDSKPATPPIAAPKQIEQKQEAAADEQGNIRDAVETVAPAPIMNLRLQPIGDQAQEEKQAGDGWSTPLLVGVLVAALGLGVIWMFTSIKRTVVEPAGLEHSAKADAPSNGPQGAADAALSK